jgi:hypothetical protein
MLESPKDLLVYDKAIHQWRINEDKAGEITDQINLYGDKSSKIKQLKAQSKTVYRYIYRRVRQSWATFVEWAFANEEEWFLILQDALIAQLEYDLTSFGAGSNTKMNAVNFNKQTTMNRHDIANNAVSIEVEEIFKSNLDRKVIWRGEFCLPDDLKTKERYTTYNY